MPQVCDSKQRALSQQRLVPRANPGSGEPGANGGRTRRTRGQPPIFKCHKRLNCIHLHREFCGIAQGLKRGNSKAIPPPQLAGPRPVRTSQGSSSPQTAFPGVHPWLKNNTNPPTSPQPSFRLFRGSIHKHHAPKSVLIRVHPWLKKLQCPVAAAESLISDLRG